MWWNILVLSHLQSLLTFRPPSLGHTCRRVFLVHRHGKHNTRVSSNLKISVMTGFLPRVRWIPLKFKGTMQGGLDFPWNSAWEICSGASGSSTNSFARNYKFSGEENKPQPVHKQLWTASHHFLRLHVMLHVETLCMNFASSGLVHQ